MCRVASCLDTSTTNTCVDFDLNKVWCGFLLSRDVDIWMPELEQQEVPAGWWDAESDRSLLAGVYKHGGFYVEQSVAWRKKSDKYGKSIQHSFTG